MWVEEIERTKVSLSALERIAIERKREGKRERKRL